MSNSSEHVCKICFDTSYTYSPDSGGFTGNNRDPLIPTPTKYSGDLGICSHFLHQCSLIFHQQPLSYSIDKPNMAIIICLLTDQASMWVIGKWDLVRAIYHSYQSFSRKLRKMFDRLVQGREVSNQLLSLHQSTTSMPSYSIDFCILLAESGLDHMVLHGWDTGTLRDLLPLRIHLIINLVR